jgi:antitoxin component YwqK of YwqJK toxin-antitoxin module
MMRILASLIVVVSIVIAFAGFAFADRAVSNNQTAVTGFDIDTMKLYSVSTESYSRNGKTTYKVNGVRVKKQEYDKYHDPLADIGNCKPCYVKTYSKSNELLYEGDQYTDCPVGYWKEYYSAGKVKLEGHYKSDSTGVWDERNSGMWCAIKHGKWTYYNRSSGVDSVVNYIDGKRINP